MIFESEALDVAFLRAPQELAAMAEARFFDGVHQADVATSLRKRWRAHHSETTSLPYFVFGFPNFGHLVDADRKIETLSAMYLPANVTQYEDYPWDGHANRAPQMMLEADIDEDSLAAENLSEMQKKISRQLFLPSSDEYEPLGGFSGGPVVCVGSDGEFLIAIIKQGTRLFGTTFSLAASCWDDCLRTFARAVAPAGRSEDEANADGETSDQEK